jgi:hypothetical protein
MLDSQPKAKFAHAAASLTSCTSTAIGRSVFDALREGAGAVDIVVSRARAPARSRSIANMPSDPRRYAGARLRPRAMRIPVSQVQKLIE